MTRPHIADPHIANKVAAGREADIRPCVGATYCLDRIYEGHEALCIHNPATGRERTIPHVIGRSEGPTKKVVIVGAGPAGWKRPGSPASAAMTSCCSRRPMNRAARSGSPPGCRVRRELIGIVDWRAEQCAKLGVDMRFNTYAEAADVLAETPTWCWSPLAGCRTPISSTVRIWWSVPGTSCPVT